MNDPSLWELILCGIVVVCGLGLYVVELLEMVMKGDK